jgi:two-component system, NtrC family, sensor kinase
LSREKEEERRWILRAAIDTHFFKDLVKDIHIDQTGEAYNINKSDLLQTEDSGGHLMKVSPDYPLLTQYKQADHCFISRDEKGLKYIYRTADLKEGNWRLVVRQAAESRGSF